MFIAANNLIDVNDGTDNAFSAVSLTGLGGDLILAAPSGNVTAAGFFTQAFGGNLQGTFTGTPAWSGAHTFKAGATFTNIGSGPALTLSGNATTLSNTHPIGWLSMSGFVGGSVSSTASVLSLTVSDKFTSTGPVPALFNFAHNIAPNGNTAVGNRIGMNVNVTAVGARQSGSYTYAGINQAAQFTLIGQCNVGGTSPSPQGAQTAVGITSLLSYDSGTSTGSTFFTGNAGMEIDTATQSGASVRDENTLLLVHVNGHAVQATREDNAIVVSDQPTATAGRKVCLAIGAATSNWPVDTSVGAVVQGRISNSYATRPSGALFGMDMQQVGFPAFNTTGRGGFLASNAFAVDGLGAVQIGTAYATPSSTGLAVDCKGIVGTGTPTIGSGGTGYIIGDIIFDAWGGIYKVSNMTSGVVTAVVLLADGNGNTRQPYYPSSSAPANPVATTPWNSGTGAGCTLNLSWNSTATTLALQPSGGDIIAAKGSVGAAGDTGGHLYIPFVAGAPTGVPANKTLGIALRYDTTNHKLWAYDNGTSTWKGVVLT